MEFSFQDFAVIGVNHTTCPVDVREKLAFTPDELSECLLDIVGGAVASESLILSTCNRTEIYFVGQSKDAVFAWLSQRKKFSASIDSPFMYHSVGVPAVRHLFKVASGLESMVLGETQILGQLKDSYRIASENKTIGYISRKIVDASFSAAKAIRSNTKIGESSISLPSASLRVAKKIFGDLEHSKILFVGAGEMVRYCAEYFARENNDGMFFYNRTFEKASKLATRFHGQVLDKDQMVARFCEFDVILTCTSSANTVLTKDMFEKSVADRKYRPTLALDLAVPRDVDEAVSSLSDVFVYTVDDLGKILQGARKGREGAALLALEYIEGELSNLTNEISRRNVGETIRKFRDHGEKIVGLEFDKAIKELTAGKDPEEVLKKFSRSLAARFMHNPSRTLNSVDNDQRELLARALVLLYGLDSST